ncbi:hypothetical protein VM57_08910 [Stenotrophomonas maltophilia]|uniref:Uncharacterized protein n=1 Tax=Stenotrophomonas maltophilia TaxID=40324 RepID=A0A0F5ZQQ7_STEMA|nr:hypothetical protein VM57_08910 [Stenotrophomonas maltophilia]
MTDHDFFATMAVCIPPITPPVGPAPAQADPITWLCPSTGGEPTLHFSKPFLDPVPGMQSLKHGRLSSLCNFSTHHLIQQLQCIPEAGSCTRDISLEAVENALLLLWIVAFANASAAALAV